MPSDTAIMLREIFQAVLDDESDLTSWEDEFIQGIKANVEAGGDLTDKQEAVLVRIWKKCTQ